MLKLVRGENRPLYPSTRELRNVQEIFMKKLYKKWTLLKRIDILIVI